MSTIQISDRVGNTIREFLLPDLRENFFRMSKQVMLRMIGMEKDETPSKGDGSKVRPRVMKAETIGVGRNFEVPHLHTALGGGVYAAAENSQLRSGKFQVARSVATSKFIQGSFEISRQAIAATRDKKFALAQEISQNAYGAVHSIHEELNRMLVGPTQGVLCYVDGAVSGSTSFTVKTNSSGAAVNETDPTRFLHPADVLWVGTLGAIQGGTAATVEVSSVTGATTFTATQAQTVSDGALVVRADAWSSTTLNEVAGLGTLVTNTGTVQNVNKANNYWFQSFVKASAGTLTVAMIDAQIMKCRNYALDPTALMLVMNSTQWRRYASLLTSTKSLFADKYEGNLAGGVEGLTYYSPDGALPVFIDEYVDDGIIYIVDPNGFIWGEMTPFDFADDALTMDGVPGQRKPGTLNYEFAFFMFGQFAQTNARGSAVISGITGPTV